MLVKELATILMKNPDCRVVVFVPDSPSMAGIIRDVVSTQIYRNETPTLDHIGLSVGESMNSGIAWDIDK